MSDNNSCEGCANASGCDSSGCEGCSGSQQSLIESPHQLSNIKKVIAVVSGKGGVGKSFVTAALANQMRLKEKQVGILDADITGPSIPKMFGLHDVAKGNELGVFATETAEGMKVMSVNLLMEDETAPVVWRGPIIAGTVKQFWTDVIWGDLDYLFVDMPPGTGDVPLTVFQSIPVDGIIVVTSPQELVSMIVKKACRMAEMMNIPVIGLVENFSYMECPDCKKKISVFGESKIEEVAKEMSLKVLAKLPIIPTLAKLADEGEFAKAKIDELADILGE